MRALFERFTIDMTLDQARSASHPGPCDREVDALLKTRSIFTQLLKLNSNAVVAELEEYGAWSPEELTHYHDNLRRLVWLAACNIVEEFESLGRTA
jgi:hypothetical protein